MKDKVCIHYPDIQREAHKINIDWLFHHTNVMNEIDAKWQH